MDPSNQAGNANKSDSGRRNSAGLFSSLMEQKRGDHTAMRRQSLHDQRPQTGFIGQMWHNFVHGGSSPPK